VPVRQIHLQLDEEFAQLLGLYTRTGETPRGALLKAIRLRATADGHLRPDGKPKLPGRPAGSRT
jgi:hypothetical protein